MKKLYKGIASVALSAVLSVSGISAFATEMTENPNVTVETFNHVSTLHEPENRTELKTNEVQKFIGNISNSSAPDVIYAGNTLMMSFTDVESATQYTFSYDNSEGEASMSGSSTVTVSESIAAYSTFNRDKQVWEAPKYIHPSSEGWYIQDVTLEHNADKIYAVCWEANSKLEQYENMFEDGFNLNISSLSSMFPETQIALHEYDEETKAFFPIKLFKAEENNGMMSYPHLITDSENLIMTWANINDEFDITLSYSKFDGENWSEYQNISNTGLGLMDLAFNASLASMPFVSGTINNKLVFGYIVPIDNNGNIKVVFVDEFGTEIFSKNILTTAIINTKLPGKNQNGFIYAAEDRLYMVDIETKNGTNQVVHKCVGENIGNITGVTATESGELFYGLAEYPNIIFKLSYNPVTKKYDKKSFVAETGYDIIYCSAIDAGEEEDLLVFTAKNNDLILTFNNEWEERNFNADLCYLRYSAAAIAPDDIPDLNPTTPETPSTKPSSPTTKPSDEDEAPIVEEYTEPITIAIEYKYSGEETTNVMLLTRYRSVSKEDFENTVRDFLQLNNKQVITYVKEPEFPFTNRNGNEIFCSIVIKSVEEIESEKNNDTSNVTDTPHTGSTSTGLIALGVLGVATIVFISLKKKKENTETLNTTK